MLKICAERPLPAECQAKYGGLAFDGCAYFATVKYKNQIVAFSRCFDLLKIFKTCRKYTALFYDRSEKCFWAAAECSSSLYKLSDCFQEIDCIRLPPHFGVVTGICAANCDFLTICTPKFMVEIQKSCPTSYTEVISCPSGACMGGVVCPPYYVCMHMKKTKQHICVFNECGDCLCDFCVPEGCTVEAILPCGPCNCRPLCFQLLTTKQCRYPFVFYACLEACDDDSFCFCGENHADCCLEDCREISCDEPIMSGYPCRIFDACCGCPGCPCRDNDCNPYPPRPSCDGRAHVLESIALMETSLAHILNAEGEKLQKIIACSDDPCVLLEANKSVKKTIISATHLEHLLFAKLDAICDCDCDPCCEK